MGAMLDLQPTTERSGTLSPHPPFPPPPLPPALHSPPPSTANYFLKRPDVLSSKVPCWLSGREFCSLAKDKGRLLFPEPVSIQDHQGIWRCGIPSDLFPLDLSPIVPLNLSLWLSCRQKPLHQDWLGWELRGHSVFYFAIQFGNGHIQGAWERSLQVPGKKRKEGSVVRPLWRIQESNSAIFRLELIQDNLKPLGCSNRLGHTEKVVFKQDRN